MADDIKAYWDEVIDYRFLEIEAELSVLREYSEAVERQLPLAVQIETERLELELSDADEYERHNAEQWMYQFTEEVLPRFFELLYWSCSGQFLNPLCSESQDIFRRNKDFRLALRT